MKFIRSWLCLGALALAGAAPHAACAAERVALVIGCGKYRADGVPPLSTPVNDARRMADSLRRAPLNFDVVKIEDATRNQFSESLSEFVDRARGAKVVLVYYSGHGIESEGRNYLIPVDAVLEKPSHVESEAIELDKILARVRSTGAEAKVVVLDACRNNPFGRTKSWSDIRGKSVRSEVFAELGEAELPEATLVCFATSAGRKAAAVLDEYSENSPFTEFLIKRLHTPGTKLRDIFEDAAEDVKKATEGRQIASVKYDGAAGVFRQLALIPPAPGSLPPMNPPPGLVAKPAFRPGTPDKDFGSNGLAVIPIGPGLTHCRGAATTADGSIVVGGESEKDVGKNAFLFILARVTPNGTRDHGFANGGRVLVNIGPFDDGGYAMCQQPDGKYIVGGRADVTGYHYDFALIRFLPNGQLDDTFGNGGKVHSNLGNGNFEPTWCRKLLLRPDGKIIAAGSLFLSKGGKKEGYAAVVRYTPEGKRDGSFGVEGLVVLNQFAGEEPVEALTALPDGRLVVVIHGVIDNTKRVMLAVLRNDGSLDTKFGSRGFYLLPFDNGGYAAAATDAQGRILIGGAFRKSGKEMSGGVVRILPTGALDSSFGQNGAVLWSLDSVGGPVGIMFDRAGRTLVGGARMTAVRLRPDGALDSTFGDGGVARLDSKPPGEAGCMTVDSKDRVILVGWTPDPKVRDLVIARFKTAP